MKLFKGSKVAAGLEVFDGGLRVGLFSQKEKGCCLERGASLSLPEDILKISFKTENILDPEGFKKEVKKILNLCHFKGGRLGVSLPHGTVKLMLQSFQEFPGDKQEMNALVKWTVTRKLALPPHGMTISWTPMGKDTKGHQVLLVAMMSELVLAQYRKELQSTGAIPVGFTPTAMNRFNFYASVLPMKGSCLYLALSRWVVTVAGFTDGVPLFFKTFRKGFLHGGMDRHCRDIALVLDHCHMICPGMVFSHIFMAFPGVKDENVRTLLRERGISHATILNPLDYITPGIQFSDAEDVSLFTATAATALGRS